MGVSLRSRIQNYFEPLYLLSISIVYLPITALFNPLLLVLDPATFRSKWFSAFWAVIGPKMAANEVQNAHIDDLLSRARGVVLELGPGNGDQMHHYSPGQIERLYGAEPNAFLHDRLRENARKAGLDGKFLPIEAGAQPGSLLPALHKAGLIPSTEAALPAEGVFDTIIAVKSMCSAPQRQMPATIAVVQALLKPGGEFLFFEHVANHTDSVTICFAWLMDLVWPAFMGGCRLDGKLDRVVLGMGGWDERQITTVGDFQGFEVIRYVKGTARKA